MLKKILLALVFVITAITNVAHAEDDMKTVASKAYVDTKIETKQLKIPAAGQPNVGAGETVMTYTATGNGEIGERGLYSDISSYDATADADKLITASALNATFTNLPTTPTTKLECANQADGCTLWTIVDQTAYGDMLPSGYTRLEYIQGDKRAYINTQFTPNNNTSAEAKYQFPNPETSASGNFVMGSRYSVSSRGFTMVGFSGSQASWASGYGNDQSSFGVSDTGIHIMKRNKEKVYLDGELKYTTPVQTFTTPGPAYIFSANQDGSPYLTSKIKLWYLKIWDDDSLVRNYVPARRNSDNVLGMYDTVSGQFFTNQGTGNFVGPSAN